MCFFLLCLIRPQGSPTLLITPYLPETDSTKAWGHWAVFAYPWSPALKGYYSLQMKKWRLMASVELGPGPDQTLQTPSPVLPTYTPHPVPKMSNIHICSGAEAKETQPRANRLGQIPAPYHQPAGQAGTLGLRAIGCLSP